MVVKLGCASADFRDIVGGLGFRFDGARFWYFGVGVGALDSLTIWQVCL